MYDGSSGRMLGRIPGYILRILEAIPIDVSKVNLTEIFGAFTGKVSGGIRGPSSEGIPLQVAFFSQIDSRKAF